MTTPLSHLAYVEIGSPDTAASTAFHTRKHDQRAVTRCD